MSARESIGKCMRCSRTCRVNAYDFDSWNAVFDEGRKRGLLCPKCQTPEEHVEAEINLATLDYGSLALDSDGLCRIKIKS